MIIKQSNTHSCFVCGLDNPNGLGIHFESDGIGNVIAHKTFSSEYQGYPGIVHGGILSAVLDEAAGRSTMKDKRPDIVLVTGKLVVHFRKPVKINQPVVIEGTMVKQFGRIFETKSTIKSETGELLVDAEVTLVQPGKALVDAIEPAEDQWIDQV